MDEAKYRYWTKEYSDHLIEDVSDELVDEYEADNPTNEANASDEFVGTSRNRSIEKVE